jgi:hypothetical protein
VFYDELPNRESAMKVVDILNAEEQIAAKQLSTIHYTKVPNFEYVGHISYD